MSARKRILIIGGVAGGASCATRARRLDETAEIILFDRGPHVSFANCGLPYYVGNVIKDEAHLLIASAELFRQRFEIEVRVRNEILRIDRAASEIEVRDLATGRIYREYYDALVLSPGAAPIRPELPGIGTPGIFVVRTIPDTQRIRAWIDDHGGKRAAIIGGGFIGIEMAENLVHRGIAVTVIEKNAQILGPFDPEIVWPAQERMKERGVTLHFGEQVTGFAPLPGGAVRVTTASGLAVETDLVILAIGVRPETSLARAAGLALGPRGGIVVDAQMRTSDPRIWAVGDAVEVRDAVTGAASLIPLAGPANRQGRIAADVICGRAASFRGVQGTAICGVLGMTVACTGASEKALVRAGITDFAKIYLHPGHHAGYFPGARPISMKLLFRPGDGLLLGAQAVGEEGVDKRIDVIAMAIQKGGTVFDLEEAEVCYAPQFGAAKDPVNFAGMIAANVVRGEVALAPWSDAARADVLLLDVRDPDEFAAGHLPGAVNIPLADLRARMAGLPRDRTVLTYCGVGQRAYYAARALTQHGCTARLLPGGYKTHLALAGSGALV
jgi:NADPH-dependent 2,4-dienoyl-CoA reductase/sulfur reductase-like enzyme/rhodanese-related sulfurtransferase